MLGGHIGRGLSGRAVTENIETDVDDRTCTRVQHRAKLCPQAVEDTVEVDRHDPTPVLDGVPAGVGQRTGDAGVVDGDVQPAIAAHDRRDRGINLLVATHVAGHAFSVATYRPDRGGRFLRRFWNHVEHDHRRAFVTELSPAGCADAGSTAGDHPDLACKTRHRTIIPHPHQLI